jgi:hypothetical protein
MQSPIFKFDVETIGEVSKVNDVVIKKCKTNLIKDWPEISSKFSSDTPLSKAFSQRDSDTIKSIVKNYFYQIKKKY